MHVLLSRWCALLLALAASGCGGSATPDRPDEPARILLGRPPAAHAGMYLARSRAFDLAEGVELALRRRRERTNPRRLLESGRVDLAVLPAAELEQLLAAGAPLVAVMAVTQGEDPLLLVATRATVADRRGVVAAAVRTLQRGYAETLEDPESAASVMADADRSLDRAELLSELDRIAPTFSAGTTVYGRLDVAALREQGLPATALDGTLVRAPVNP